MEIESISVFCGSSFGTSPEYSALAAQVGEFLAQGNIRLVYGGGRVGLMGVVADTVLQNSGTVLGIIPTFLQTREIIHEHISDTIVTNTMHERKQRMHEESDAVLVLPGGFGTFDELFEMLTWAQLGLHTKPIVLLNTHGFFDSLLHFVRHSAQQGFIQQHYVDMLLVATTPTEALQQMRTYIAPPPPTWLEQPKA